MHQVSIVAAASLLLWPQGASSFSAGRLPPAATTTTSSALSSSIPPHQDGTGRRELHLLTFDLDDTIFPITPVVADANVAQLQTLIRLGYDGATNERIIAASKRIRNELRESGDVITYTDLRKRSIRREIERLTASSNGDDGLRIDDSVVEAAFGAWLSERHASADRNLFPHAVSALEAIRTEHPRAVIGAITNGRGDPLEMGSIREYFDWCVSGEDQDVFPARKPDEGIYRAALRRYGESRRTDGGVEELTWVHVGDDLANDGQSINARRVFFVIRYNVSHCLPIYLTAISLFCNEQSARAQRAGQKLFG